MGATTVVGERRALLEDAVAAARDAARSTGERALVTWTEPVAETPDPIAFFAAADAAEARTFWQQPEKGIALVGSGVAFAVRGDGRNRFAAAGDVFSLVAAQAVSVADTGVTRVGPVAVGGFAFDPERPRGAAWTAFPDGLLVVPRALLRVADGAATLSITTAIDGGDAVEDVVTAMDVEARRRSRLPGLVPVCVDPPPPVMRREAPPAVEWKRSVAEAAADVRAGRFDKVVLARSERVVVDGDIDVPGTLLRMRDANPTASLFAIALPGSAFVGASPETLVRIDGGMLRTTPLAGSIGRGATPGEDDRLARRLLRSGKDRHEHEVVVGAILQALDPLCLDLAPDLDAPLVVANRTVQHLATPISGRVRPEVGVLDVVQRLHPTPAVGGYPTEAALAAIREREAFDRGWYAGAFGWIDASGDGEFAVAIRSALVAGNAATLYAGCGVMGDSDPDSEYEETRLKLRAIGAALGAA